MFIRCLRSLAVSIWTMSFTAQADSSSVMHIASITAICETTAGHSNVTPDASQIKIIDGQGRSIPISGGRINVTLLAGREANCGNLALAAKYLENTNFGYRAFRISFRNQESRPGTLQVTGITTCGNVSTGQIVEIGL